ncbi:GGDEF domain-containing protein [Paucibacter sp. Y2R2-4]|uniref:GGDEF domain-containing protein n=1 Tax=Paucibacter sp. Y2R2-4 TaxID=2893553 RepID=UPI0021E35A34|nr:GGDEF domain-containing protein [Paucibacter sp. Y2R2-4]MCV2351684.1 diguanylate cyclase [Paucibacter sp. Y2R2-4]
MRLPPAPPLDAALDQTLSRLQRLAFDRPTQALQDLKRLQAEARNRDFDGQLLQAEARIQLRLGQGEQTLAIAQRLAQDAQQAARAHVLRAEEADYAGRSEEAAQHALKALEALAPWCAEDRPAQQVIQQGCDFRNAWSALRLREEKQGNDGALALAEATARRRLDLAEAGQDDFMRAQSLGALALLSQRLEQPEQAKRWITQALQLAQGQPLTQAYVKGQEASLAARQGQIELQVRALDEALDLAKKADAPHVAAYMQLSLADANLRLKQPARAKALVEQALPTLLQYGDRRPERTARNNLVQSLILLGQFDAAHREIAQLNQMDKDQAGKAALMEELREQGEAWASMGRPKEAIADFHQERKLNAELVARNRQSSLEQLKVKYDSDRKQREFDLLVRDKSLVERQLANRQLTQQVGLAMAVLLGLSLVLAGVMVNRVRQANKKLKANEVLLRAQSERDPLTDLANRRYFLAVMEQQQNPQEASFNGALLMIDIDHFKHVNDQHGHGIGDVVICEVARRLSHAVRAEDLVVRWGGEEFLVFAPDVSQEQLSALAERILQGVGATTIATEDGPLRITVSIGFAHFPLPPSNLTLPWEQAVNWADMALYTAKSQGRNRAMGIATVDARDTDALTQIEADFDAACSSERVSLTQVLGPQAAQA